MSKLRADEFVNSDDNGAPSFPHSATVPAPTADDHFATKLYADTSASTKSSSITNTISNTAPSNPSVGDFWTDTSTQSIIYLRIWNGSSWVNIKSSLEISAGQIVTPPSISDPNGGYIPTMLTATSAVVSDATLSSSKWYKDDVEIPGATGLQFYATEIGTYKYEEIWVDAFGTQLFPSLSAVIDARAGVIDAQPTITSSNGVYSPTTLTATAAVVSNATFVGSKWYKDGVEVPGETGLSINILVHEQGVYKYEETWTDAFGTQLLPTLSASVQVFATIADPTVLTPADDTGAPDFDYTAESSAITNVTSVQGGGSVSVDSNGWKSVTYGGGKFVAVAFSGSNRYMYSSDGINWTAAATANDSQSWNTITYGNGKFVALSVYGSGNRLMYSNTPWYGWSSASIPSSSWTSVTYGDGKFVAVAQDGSTRIAYSTNGSSWNYVDNPVGAAQWKSITYGNGMFVAVSGYGAGNRAMYSTNGTSWYATASSNDNNSWNSVVYGNGKFVAVARSGDSNLVMYSTDGINWTGAQPSSNASWTSVIYADGKFVAVAEGGTNRAMYSTDGINWTGVASADESNEWQSITYGDGKFVAVASNGNSNRVMYSSTGTNWGPDQTTLTFTDTTVSKVSDGSLIEGESIDQVLTVGETVQADTTISSTVATPVFDVTTYTGNGSTMSISTGIDLTTKGLLWFSGRSGSGFSNTSHGHFLFDSERNNYGDYLKTTDSDRQMSFADYGWEPQPDVDGTVNNLQANLSANNINWVNWAFRAAPGFFDVVTYTGQYTWPNSFAVPHSLGSVPGMIVIKNINMSSGWTVWHKNLSSTTGKALDFLYTNAEDSHSGFFPTAPTSTEFYLGDNSNINQQNQSYVAYVFADTPGVIKCGTYTGTGSSQTINTGFKPKFVLTKSRSHSSDWYLMDSARPGKALYANQAQQDQTVPIGYVNNGFTVDGANFALNTSGYEYIYMAIAEDAEVDITSDIRASGTVSASTGNTVTLSNSSGTWSTGMKVQGTDSDTKDYPDPISPSAVSLTSSEPAVTQGSVTTWGNAQWQIAEDSGFTTNLQSLTSALTSSGTQTGPTGFTLDHNKNYYVRTKYGSSNPAGIFSNWSVASLFKTGAAPLYADDLFSTYLYEGTGSAQTITNGIDLSGEGGMVWLKNRRNGGSWTNHVIVDSERIGSYGHKSIYPSTSESEYDPPSGSEVVTAFGSDGFTQGENLNVSISGGEYVSWTFRKAPGFFDVVTWTGTNDGTRIPHNLGSLPGMIMVKNVDSSEGWKVFAKKEMWVDGETYAYYQLGFDINAFSSTVANISNADTFNPQSMSSEASGTNYVAYLFADDDARFGTNGDESIIKCGIYTGNESTDGPEINLGWEPQWLMYKKASEANGNWEIIDTMRGMPNAAQPSYSEDYMKVLNPNTSAAESTDFSTYPTPTGFKITNNGGSNNGSGRTYVYMAIRRPHKPATVATDVFAIDNGSSSPTTPTWDSGFPVDMSFINHPNSGAMNNMITTRLLGTNLLYTNNTDTEVSSSSFTWDSNLGWGKDYNYNAYSYMFRRAPGFFDVVSWNATGQIETVPHGLGVVPEMMILKPRNWSNGSWGVYHNELQLDQALLLESDAGTFWSTIFNQQTPTSTDFYVNYVPGDTVVYLFASQPGISKVGSFTGTGGNIDIDCGFDAGARFVLIKRTDSTGDWYFWDTVHGITSGNDPYSLVNTYDAQVTNTDYIDPLNAGFTVTSSAPADLNQNGGQYLFLAIA